MGCPVHPCKHPVGVFAGVNGTTHVQGSPSWWVHASTLHKPTFVTPGEPIGLQFAAHHRFPSKPSPGRWQLFQLPVVFWGNEAGFFLKRAQSASWCYRWPGHPAVGRCEALCTACTRLWRSILATESFKRIKSPPGRRRRHFCPVVKRELGPVAPALTPALTGTAPTPCRCSRSGFDPPFLLPKYSGSRRGRYGSGSKQESLVSAHLFCQLMMGFRENCVST